MLAVAYGSNVGGIGTKIGTVPSAQLSGFLAQRGTEVSFLEFMAVGMPFVAAVPAGGLARAVARRAAPTRPAAEVGAARSRARARGSARCSAASSVVGAVFLAAATLWILGKPITDALRARGFARARHGAGRGEHRDAREPRAGALARRAAGRRWRRASLRFIQWETLVLLGGGFSLAAAIEASGLSHWMGAQLAALRGSPPLLQITAASFTTVTLSAFASNAATVAVMLPVLAAASRRST